MPVDQATPKSQRAPLSRPRVVAEAVALADDVGLDALSMRKLADRLGVEAMSLYHHVANKDDLLDGMVDDVFSQIELPDLSAPWQPATRARAHSARAVLRRHPWAIALVDSRTNPGPATLTHHDAVLGCLRSAGFPLPLAAHAVSAIDAYVIGFSLAEAALPFDTGEEAAELAGQIAAGFDADAYPNLAEMARDHVMVPGYDYADEFGYGLDLILDGLAAELARTLA